MSRDDHILDQAFADDLRMGPHRVAEPTSRRAIEVVPGSPSDWEDVVFEPADFGRASIVSYGVDDASTGCVVQPWVMRLPMMQQSVLLASVRGPDGLPKYHAAKWILRWYRRCILLSAMDGRVIENPVDEGGGSFTGPSVGPDWATNWQAGMDARVDDYLAALDEVPHHFQMHLMHAVEIVGYKHDDGRIGDWWHAVYLRLVHDMHLWPETEDQLDERLGDNRDGWLARADRATLS